MRWLVELAIGALALTGLWVTLAKAAAGLERAWEWARRDRVTPPLECICGPDETGEDIDVNPDCPEHGYGWDEDDLEELPPERSAAALGFGAEQERRAPPWEAFQRIQYEAMGFEYPSGLMARVMELTP